MAAALIAAFALALDALLPISFFLFSKSGVGPETPEDTSGAKDALAEEAEGSGEEPLPLGCRVASEGEPGAFASSPTRLTAPADLLFSMTACRRGEDLAMSLERAAGGMLSTESTTGTRKLVRWEGAKTAG